MQLKFSLRRIRRRLRRLVTRLQTPAMIVRGNDAQGYSAHYRGESDMVWASRRESAVDGCALRRAAVRAAYRKRGASRIARPVADGPLTHGCEASPWTNAASFLRSFKGGLGPAESP